MAGWDETNPEDGDLVSQFPANERAARDAVRTNFGVDHHEANDADIGKHEVIQLTAEATPTITAGDVGLWNDGGVLKTRSGAGAVQAAVLGGSTDALVAPVGTKIVFYQASAPTGWTQDTAVNDRVLKVVSGTGGGTGGSWTISGVTVDNHTLTVSEMPSHNHGGTTANDGAHDHGGSTGNDGDHDHHSARASSNNNNLGINAQIAREGNISGEEYTLAGVETGTPVGLTTAAPAHSHTISTQPNHLHGVFLEGGGTAHNHGLTADGTWRPSHIDVIVAEKD